MTNAENTADGALGSRDGSPRPEVVPLLPPLSSGPPSLTEASSHPPPATSAASPRPPGALHTEASADAPHLFPSFAANTHPCDAGPPAGGLHGPRPLLRLWVNPRILAHTTGLTWTRAVSQLPGSQGLSAGLFPRLSGSEGVKLVAAKGFKGVLTGQSASGPRQVSQKETEAPLRPRMISPKFLKNTPSRLHPQAPVPNALSLQSRPVPEAAAQQHGFQDDKRRHSKSGKMTRASLTATHRHPTPTGPQL